MNRLMHSAKFWTAALDAVVSIALLLSARYLSPSDVKMVQQMVLILQPVFVVVIAAIAAEDIATAKAMAKE